MKTIITILLSVFVTLPAFALENTPANREEQVTRYMRAISFKELAENTLEGTVAATLKEEQAAFRRELRKEIDIAGLTRRAKTTLVNCLTADELKALADFYSSPIGKAASSKSSRCVGDLMTREMQSLAEQTE